MVTVPVFVSIPRALNTRQGIVHSAIENMLGAMRLEPRTVGRSDQALQSPLGEVYQLARRCSGGLILGFRQATAASAVLRPGCDDEEVREQAHWPSAWNQLEAGVLYAIGVPLLVFAERGVTGGIFDRGVGNMFIHDFSSEAFDEKARAHMETLIHEWTRHVRNFYMDDTSREWRK